MQFYYVIIDSLGIRLIATYSGLILAHLFFCIPYTVATVGSVITGGLINVENAARIAGASELRVLRRVTLPALMVIDNVVTMSKQVAYQEAIVRPVLDQLKALRSLPDASPTAHDAGDARIVTTDRELAVYRYVCRRLAFLVSDEHHFAAIEQVQHRDYIGKFVVFYQNVRKGRIFDFIEGGNGYDKFVFPAPIGEIVTNNISEIDEPLRNVFSARVRELGSGQPSELRRPMALKTGDHTLSVGIAPVRCIVSSSRT